MKIVYGLLIILFLAGANAFAGDYIRLGSDSILINSTDYDLVFYAERTCPNPSMIVGASNGFVITANGSATYQYKNLYQDPGSSVTWELGGLLFTNGLDGIFPDTMLVGGASMMIGMPIFFDEPYFHLIIDVGPGTGELCIDSAFVFAAGQWRWYQLTCGLGSDIESPLFVDKSGIDITPPHCIEIYTPFVCGDVNCDGVANVSDAVWIINYIFVGGKQPCDTSGDGISDCYGG